VAPGDKPPIVLELELVGLPLLEGLEEEDVEGEDPGERVGVGVGVGVCDREGV